MAHAVHTTPAVVLGSTDVQDANRLFWLLTEELGLVFASARSVREEVSKLRYSLNDLMYTRISLVRGRGLWRVTGAEIIESEKLHTSAAEVFGRIATLCRRVVPTDEENPEVFRVVCAAREALVSGLYDEELVEQVTVARVLYHVGYLSCIPAYDGVVNVLLVNKDVLTQAVSISSELVLDINKGLLESQL